MPTIAQLAPATAASDNDELLVNQGGITRKVTRAQILAGVQPQLAVGSGTLLGRVSAGLGAPETIKIGANLSLNNGTLIASATPFVVASLGAGTVPAVTDLVPLAQGGSNLAVTYSQFMSGLAGVTNVDVSQLLVTPTGKTPTRLGDFAATVVPLTGATLTGPLTLSGDPATVLQAATKSYVDGQFGTALPKAGGTLTGALTLATDPATTMQATTRRYVDTQVATALPLAGGALTGPLSLAANPTTSLQAAPKQYVDTKVAAALPLAGGALTGALTLATDPSSALHAATKRYVDMATGASTGVINVRAAPYNAMLNGVADDTAAFKAAYQAAAPGSVIYVPNGITVLKQPNTWGIPLTKRVKWVVDGTTELDGTALANGVPGGNSPANTSLPGIVVGNSSQSAEISRTGSDPADYAVLHTSYVVNHDGGPLGGAVVANTRHDTIIYNSPNNFVRGAMDRLLWCGTRTPSAAQPAEHVARYVQAIRQSIGTDSSSNPLPQPNLWTAYLEYRDTTGKPSSWAAASITVQMDWYGNGPDDGSQRQIQSLVVAQNDPAGAPVEVSTVIGVYLGGGSTGHVHRVLNVNIPFSTAVLDTTSAKQMDGAAAIRLAAGHSIAFEPTNQCRLGYDDATNTLRWHQGTLSYPVGKGITVGWLNVCASSTTLPNYLAGNIVFLVGNGASYTITLPLASSVAAGTGFTFSVLGTATVTIATTASDTIDCGPITLRPNDRYHIVSNSDSNWHEVFRSNAVNPRFTAPPVLPSYTVAALPASPGTGAMAFATNGRKPSDGVGAGTGVGVFYDGGCWISVCNGSQVAA